MFIQGYIRGLYNLLGGWVFRAGGWSSAAGYPGPVMSGLCHMQPFSSGTCRIQPLSSGEVKIHES